MATVTQTIRSPPQIRLKRYQQVPESKQELDWADLVTLDLSQFDSPGGKQKLAIQLRDAVHNVGFFYITGFGLSQHEVDQQFAIARDVFDLPTEEKMKYRADLESGNYNGYRPQGSIELFPGLRDNIEMYNIFKFIHPFARDHPEVIAKHRPEIERFQRHIVGSIVRKLLTLISIILELPEDYLSRGHTYEDNSECHIRYIMYRARAASENLAYKNLYARGHTDFGSLTLLFRQPIAALQVRMPDGRWKWVKPHPGSITVNIADVLQFWTNGYLKSSVHRVVAPPQDQEHLDRLGVLYFVRPAQDLDLSTVESPLLERLGLRKGGNEAEGIKAGEWVRQRVRQNLDRAVEGKETEVEVMGGVKVQYYH